MKTVLQLLFVSCILFLSSNTEADPAVIAPKAEQSLLLDIVKITDQRLLTVGERGHILISEDKGNSWRQVAVPVQTNLTAVDFLDEKHGVAVGFDQTVLLTEDSGETWTVSHKEVSNFQPALFSVVYVAKNKITAVGSYGLYLETTDGGQSWENRQIDTLSDIYDGFTHFYDLERLSADIWYMAGEKYIAETNDIGEEFSKGMVAVTKDGGKTWTKVNSPYEGSFFGITVNNDDIYVYGLIGNLFHSDDEGETWQRIELTTQAGLHDMLITQAGDLVLVGTGGVLVEKSGSDIDVTKRSDLKGRAGLVGLGNGRFVIVGEGGVETFDVNDKKETAVEGQ